MARMIKKGATSQSIYVVALDSTSTTGGRKTGLAYNTSSLTAYYTRNGGSATAIMTAVMTQNSPRQPPVTVTTLGMFNAERALALYKERFADFGDYTFKVGDGPAWCTINADRRTALCEQSEADAKYAPIPVPNDCEFSYGYQVQLFADAPEDGTKIADFVCSGGAYADPNSAATLNSGERITLGGITCFVEGTAARCENEAKNFAGEAVVDFTVFN